ncbi:N-6 DNA methylase [Candidatus Pantoea floridensis]|uniref:N-6 DNA Methylase n=1 Tax=Candidatus Pantoea floridensis TaxID=1938870 RepID=A0A286DR69_9GAMM|nr:N-6 DNA methylase [Pantoea floridensis]PIF07524.1 N-6 DNA methylase [Enterobacteriaceae bacterium JKS000233]SOD61178.1 N-6 DNA Methylase [Pantoea floridensis]
MSQLSFAEFFDQSKDRLPSTAPVSLAPVPAVVPRMMSLDASRRQFIRVFRDTGNHLRRWDVFSDFITLCASELDIARIRSPESMDRCRKICDRYSAADIQNMHELFQLMVCALEAEFHDFLGAIFMELELGDDRRGQYFTPYCVQSMMARMLMPGVKETIEREGFFTLSEPTCGAGGIVIAYAECMLESGLNPSMQMFVSCIDIDPIAADMAFIQLSLLGIAAEVTTGNTLTLQLSRVRYTPVYYLNDFEERLSAQRRVKAMRDFIQRIS